MCLWCPGFNEGKNVFESQGSMKIKAGVQYFWQRQVLSVSGTESVGKWMRPLGMSTPSRLWGAWTDRALGEQGETWERK